ncbi:MAG: hypothetical protein KAS16_05195 [Thermoplasmata archaeon]|nr:hypothetical protein [Thermoplasmata archaeon]
MKIENRNKEDELKLTEFVQCLNNTIMIIEDHIQKSAHGLKASSLG